MDEKDNGRTSEDIKRAKMRLDSSNRKVIALLQSGELEEAISNELLSILKNNQEIYGYLDRIRERL